MLLGDANYYEIVLLSLMWLSEDDGEQSQPRSVSPTLHTLRTIGIINWKQCKAAIHSQMLRNRFLREIDICKAGMDCTYQEALDRSLRQSPKHLALPFASEIQFEQRQVIAKNGYRFLLTASGLSFAQKKVSPYESIVTREQFLQGHAAMSQRVSQIAATIKIRNAAGQGADTYD